MFLSSYENKIDKKGRVSVPATFRSHLSSMGYNGFISYPSFNHAALEACSQDRIERLSQTIDSLNPETQSKLMKKDSGGQRLLSLMGALSEKDSSEVTFSELDLNIKLQIGEILVLHNCYDGSISPNPKSKYTIRATNKSVSWYLKLIFRERLIK